MGPSQVAPNTVLKCPNPPKIQLDQVGGKTLLYSRCPAFGGYIKLLGTREHLALIPHKMCGCHLVSSHFAAQKQITYLRLNI